MRVLLATLAVVLLAAPLAQAASGSPAAPRQTWIWSDPQGTGDLDALLGALGRLQAPTHRLPALGMVAFQADAATAHALRGLAGGRLDEDRWVDVHLDQSVPYIGADKVKRALGARHDGPTVLVVDTGIDSNHPDFTPGSNLAANVQTVRVGGLTVGDREDAPVVDQAGHGTHVAGIVAGSGAALGTQDELHGKYTGVYSIGRVAGFQASGVEEGQQAKVEIVAALEAFEWALDNQQRLDIRVVTNSWGEQGSFDPDGPVQYATRRLYLAGMTVVFSAGNTGADGPGTLNRYCVAPWVLCVAAGDLNDTRLGFSSLGTDDPAKPWDHPDLTAPGLFVTSARPLAKAPSLLGGAVPSLGAPPSEALYTDRSGTSIATPHVAGAAALLLAANPALSPDQVMDILVTTTRPMDDRIQAVGAGYLDAAAAYEKAKATPGDLPDFLAGRSVLYAGAASGDAAYAQDPVSVGVQGHEPSSGVLAAARERIWLATPTGIGVVLVTLALVVVGTRSRFA